MILLIAFAFLAGIVTVLSPCILPILPVILTSSIGGVNTGKSRPMGVVTGFILSFTFFTLFLSTIVRLSGIPADALRLLSIIVIAGFGISLLVPQFQILTEHLFSKLSSSAPHHSSKSGFGGGLLIGMSIGLLWTPCVGPILASVISLAITGTVTFDAFLITASYAVGTAIPMFLIMLSGQNALKRIPWLLSHLGHIQKLFGVFMILTAIALVFNIDRQFQTFVLNTFPQYGAGITKLEDNTLVRSQLQKRTNPDRIPTGDRVTTLDQTLAKGPRAPEIIPGGSWFNSTPLTLRELKGKVVLLDFWTYSCINCQRTLPYLKNWYMKYKDKGLVIIGVHSPEFEFEKDAENVRRAIKDFGLAYPVVQDNAFDTWRAYQNQYWPAKYFIDKDGYIRHYHFGEGSYDESEQMIQELLKETGASNVESKISNPSYRIDTHTPETYLGYGRLQNFGSPETIQRDTLADYTAPPYLDNNRVAFSGPWNVMEEYANPQKGAALILNFDAKEVYIVMRTKGIPSKIKVYVDGAFQYFTEQNANGVVTVTNDALYKIVQLQTSGRHTLRLEFEDDNAELFAFTFG